MRSISGIRNYLTSCQAFEEMNETLVFPATINMNKETEPAVISDDETSIPGQASDETNVQEQVIVNQEPPSSNQIEIQDNEGQMRGEPKEIIFEDDSKVDEEEPVYADDKQEYMHWHYKLNHPSYTVMSRMAKKHMLPRRIIKILRRLDKQDTQPPRCNDCCGA
jgi:23S rRNA-/tRNA-specific pseudouridylate synthase